MNWNNNWPVAQVKTCRGRFFIYEKDLIDINRESAVNYALLMADSHSQETQRQYIYEFSYYYKT